MKSLEILAAKLGVATEHLWGVLIQQAPISGAFELINYVAMAASVYGVVVLWKFINNKVTKDGWNDIAYIWPGIASILAAGFLWAAIFSLPTTFAAFFNPEYWALKQVLSAIK